MIHRVEVQTQDYLTAQFKFTAPKGIYDVPPVVTKIFEMMHVKEIYTIPYTPLVLFVTGRRIGVTQLLGHGDFELLTLCPIHHFTFTVEYAITEQGMVLLRIGKDIPPFALTYHNQF